SIDWPSMRAPRRRRRFLLLVIAALAVIVLGGRAALSYYVDLLWFDSLGYRDVFWKTLGLQWGIFTAFAAATFLILYGSFLVLKRTHLPDLPSGRTIFIGGQPLKLPVEPVLRLIAVGLSLVIAVATGAGVMLEWPTIALFWCAAPAAGGFLDPVFGKPLNFFLFSLPGWQLIVGWLLTLALMTCVLAVFFILITGGIRAFLGRSGTYVTLPWRGLTVTFAFLLLILAVRVYLGRFEQLFDGHTIFAGVTYSDAHIMLPGMLAVCAALILGAVIASANAVRVPRGRWIAAAILPAALCYVSLLVVAWYVSSFIVKPNELVREQPYITHNIELTRQAYGLDRVSQREFPAETDVAAADPANNQATLQNIRLWDWHALQDTLRQIQEIRTYYDFPDIDIDRYQIDGVTRQVMLATRELNVDRLPESSRNWINEKLIYTHGYGITMNPVNGFTPEGLPTLILSNMPVQSTVRGLTVIRPEVYFGELTNTDVYVKTRQKEFNYPQGQTNSLTSYEGNGGIVLGSFLRRIIIALDRGDLAKLPFSDDVNNDSQLLMNRNVRDRVSAIAPFLTCDPDPYIVLGDDGRLSWVMDAFTVSDSYPYASHYRLGRDPINYMRNSVKVVIDAYNGATTFYVFDAEDPIIATYRRIFPSLFKDAAMMPAGLRKHMR
ncbi:MAG: membrane protein, partial [Acidobacteria bacterium]